MFSGVKSALSAAFHPARVLHHGWKNRENIPDEDDRRRVTRLYDLSEAMVTLGSVCVLSSPLLRQQSEAAFLTGQTAMVVGGTYSLRLVYDFAVHGKAMLEQEAKKKALAGPSKEPDATPASTPHNRNRWPRADRP